MKKFALVMGLVLAMGAGFMFIDDVSAQLDPWWRPLNPYGQSYGITYGTTPDPAPPNGELMVDMDGGADGGPVLQLYDAVNGVWDILFSGGAGGITDNTIPVWDATAGAWEDSTLTYDGTSVGLPDGEYITFGDAGVTDAAIRFVAVGRLDIIYGTTSTRILDGGGEHITTHRDVGAAGASYNLTTDEATLSIMNGTDTVRGLFVDLTNANHTGAGNLLYGMDVDGITGDAEALEYGVRVGSGWEVGFFHVGIAHAALPAATNGSITFCTNCDPASTPCTTGGASTGAFAFRVNGQWDCPW